MKLKLFFTLICTLPLGAMQQYIIQCNDGVAVQFTQPEIEKFQTLKDCFEDIAPTPGTMPTTGIPYPSTTLDSIRDWNNSEQNIIQKLNETPNAKTVITALQTANYLDASFFDTLLETLPNHRVFKQLSESQKKELYQFYTIPKKIKEEQKLVFENDDNYNPNGTYKIYLPDQNLTTLVGIELLKEYQPGYVSRILELLKIKSVIQPKKITEINLAHNKLKSAHLEFLIKMFPDARIFNLTHNQINDLTAEDVSCLRNDMVIKLDGNPLQNLSFRPQDMPYSFFQGTISIDEKQYKQHKQAINTFHDIFKESYLRKTIKMVKNIKVLTLLLDMATFSIVSPIMPHALLAMCISGEIKNFPNKKKSAIDRIVIGSNLLCIFIPATLAIAIGLKEKSPGVALGIYSIGSFFIPYIPNISFLTIESFRSSVKEAKIDPIFRQ